MTAGSCRLRRLVPDDIEALHRLSIEFGWPHRIEDWRFALGLGRGSVSCDGEGGVVGSAVWWPFGPEAGAVGMVMVSPRWQGRGLGRRLMGRVLAEAGTRRLMLNATPAGLPLYERDGFARLGEVRQRQGVATPPPPDADSRANIPTRPLAPADMAAVRALDREATGHDRTHLLDALSDQAAGRVHEVEGRVAGFAFTRTFGRGHVVGPLVAQGDAAAIALLAPSLEAHAGAFLRADTAVADGPFTRVLERAGLLEVDVAITMVRGRRREPQERATGGGATAYCLASQALG